MFYRTLFCSVFTATAINMLAIPSPVQAQYQAYACTNEQFSSVNLRRGPSKNYSILASIPNHHPIRVFSWLWGPDNMRWLRVESNGIVGFARADYVCW